jgi:hypothetical protein
MTTQNPIFYLISDYAHGPWGGVFADWCDYAKQPTLCLTDDPRHANAYLVVAHQVEQVAAVLRDGLGLDPTLSTVWINPQSGAVRRALSPDELLTTVMTSDAERPCRCGRRLVAADDPDACCERCEAKYQAWLDHVARSEPSEPEIADEADVPVPRFAVMPAHKLQGGFLEAGEFDGRDHYQFEKDVVFRLGPNGDVWARIGSLDEVPDATPDAKRP